MARIAFPYPPSPTDFPDELTDPPPESTAAIMAVLSGLFLFILAYFGLILASGLIIFFGVTGQLSSFLPVNIGLAIVAFVVGLVLLLGVFNREGYDPEITFELEPDNQPVFFAFLKRITKEVGAPMPDKVFLIPDVNAALSMPVSLINLFVKPEKHLIVGLGLVNSMNLSEFKAVIGHEFGHFSQKTTRLSNYVNLARRIMINLVVGEDWIERSLQAAKRHTKGQDAVSILSWGYIIVVGWPVWTIRYLMKQVLNLMMLAYLSMSRANEFHADRIAVSVAGSNAIVHGLCRLDFANESLGQAVVELRTASQHKLYTDDLYLHHTAAMGFLRKKNKKPRLGLPPELETDEEGEDIRVFKEDDDMSDLPPMLMSHPPLHAREENAKEIFVPAIIDERSPWILFNEADVIRERMTYRFYRVMFGVKKTVKLTPASKVQGFIDDERAETTYDPKYAGCYDERSLFLGNFDELEDLAKEEEWDTERISRVHARLYTKLDRKVQEFDDLRHDIRKLMKKTFGKPKGRDKRQLEELEDEFQEVIDWFTSFDRRVFLVYAQMAKQVGIEYSKELSHRYDFHLRLQEIHTKVRLTQERVEDIIAGLNHFGAEIPQWFFHEMMDTLGEGRRNLKKCLQQAEVLLTPAMANVEKGTRLDELIFEGELLREIPTDYVTSKWVNKLSNQLAMTRQRVLRMDFKSLGAILLMQDRLHAAWLAKVNSNQPEPTTSAEPSGEWQTVNITTTQPPPLPKRNTPPSE